MECTTFKEKEDELISILKGNFKYKEDIEHELFKYAIYFFAESLCINQYDYKHFQFINRIKQQLIKQL
jgi:hypothetical protein